MALKRAPIKNLKEIKDGLLVLESSMRKLETKKAKSREEPKPIAGSPSDESASNLDP